MYSGLTNPFGRKNGRLITVQDLNPQSERGLNCGCVCPNCNAPFESRMGSIKVWHFAHSGTPCDQTKSFINSIYELAHDALLKYGKIWVPPIYAIYIKSDYSPNGRVSFSSYKKEHSVLILQDSEIVVDNVEYAVDSNGVRQALLINDGKLAIRIDIDKEYCVMGTPSQYKDMDTFVVDLKDLVFKFGTEQLHKAIVGDCVFKYWKYNSIVSDWKKKQDEKNFIAFKKAEEERLREQKRLEKERLEEERLIREEEKRLEEERAEEDRLRKKARLKERLKQETEFLNTRNKTLKVYEILSKYNHISGHMISAQDNGRYEKRVKIDFDISDLSIDINKCSITFGLTGRSGCFFIQEFGNDNFGRLKTGKPYFNLDLRGVDIDSIESYLVGCGFGFS